MRNIEIKAKITDEYMKSFVLEKAREITNKPEEILVQHDTFFKIKNNSENARLKLRQFSDGAGELIYYERPDTKGPKLSDYKIVRFRNKVETGGLRDILIKACGVLGEVKKIRRLYNYYQTRIHIDEVEHLGTFVELEVCLTDDQSIESGEKLAKELMKALKIPEYGLISGAYLDLLLENKKSP